MVNTCECSINTVNGNKLKAQTTGLSQKATECKSKVRTPREIGPDIIGGG
jgi:hypothetical protein